MIPRLLEITYLRRDRASFVGAHDPIPTMLDYPNIPGMPELVLTPLQGNLSSEAVPLQKAAFSTQAPKSLKDPGYSLLWSDGARLK